MRRNSADQDTVALIALGLFLFGVQILSALYPLIPPFVGFFFTYAILYYGEEKKRGMLLLIFLYSAFFELSKGFYLFSYAMLFLLLYRVAKQGVQQNTSCEYCIIALYVSVGYMGHYLLNIALAYALEAPFVAFSNYYLYYMGIDFLLALALLRVSR